MQKFIDTYLSMNKIIVIIINNCSKSSQSKQLKILKEKYLQEILFCYNNFTGFTLGDIPR